MVSQIEGLRVVGGTFDAIPFCNHPVEDGDQLSFGSISISCLLTPGHTMGHICYYCEEEGSDHKVVFTGDTLFIGGCGRFFEGTAEDYFPSLFHKLAPLPPDTEVYCGHEYTLANLSFAVSIDPSNQELLEFQEESEKKRESGTPTVLFISFQLNFIFHLII